MTENEAGPLPADAADDAVGLKAVVLRVDLVDVEPLDWVSLAAQAFGACAGFLLPLCRDEFEARSSLEVEVAGAVVRLEEVDGVSRHGAFALVGVGGQHRHLPRRERRGFGRHLPLLYHAHVVVGGEFAGRGTADDARADDDDVVLCRPAHRSNSWSTARNASSATSSAWSISSSVWL